MDLSLIIPCYNEEGNVQKLFEECEKVFCAEGISCEYVFVNDGSDDNTKAVLKKLWNENDTKNITVVNFSRNFGKEAAIYAGLKNSVGENTCIIDADLQQQPSVALKMYKLLTANNALDCVCAYQNKRSEGKMISAAKSVFYKIMNSAAETSFKNGASDFRVFNSKVKSALLSLGEYHRFSKGLFSWVGFNVEYIEYEADKRNAGKSKWSLWKLLRYGVSGMLDFSTAPLKMATIIGSLATVFSMVYFIVTIIRKLTYNITVDGFTQIVILITFFSGVLLFTVGIIGEYIARIYQQVKNRPVYIVDEILKREDGEEIR